LRSYLRHWRGERCSSCLKNLRDVIAFLKQYAVVTLQCNPGFPFGIMDILEFGFGQEVSGLVILFE
jgi:hypothetical protein